jgi:hypothetical protein
MKYDGIKDGMWAYNFGDSERWNVEECFDTAEEAIEAGNLAARENGVESFEVGELNIFKPSLDADWAIEHISENAWDECGEHGEDYLNHLPVEEIDRLSVLLNEALHKWLEETNNHPRFYTISSTSVHSIEQRSEGDVKRD